MEICQVYPPLNSMIRSHLFQMLKDALRIHTDIRQRLAEECRTVPMFVDAVHELARRLENGENPPEEAIQAEVERLKRKKEKKEVIHSATTDQPAA